MSELTEIHKAVLAEMSKSHNRMYEIGDKLAPFLQSCLDAELEYLKPTNDDVDWPNYKIKKYQDDYNGSDYPGLQYLIQISSDEKEYTINIYPSGQVVLTAQNTLQSIEQEPTEEDFLRDEFDVEGLSIPEAIARISNRLINVDYEGLGLIIISQSELMNGEPEEDKPQPQQMQMDPDEAPFLNVRLKFSPDSSYSLFPTGIIGKGGGLNDFKP